MSMMAIAMRELRKTRFRVYTAFVFQARTRNPCGKSNHFPSVIGS